ncbi:hypothetical protein CYFUS_007169 [Cystobacter fuscus]|uniref:Lipoprotein n=1 Tax=Cystobacter fuscus TaxID=43 RepID=A0A250JCS0_9BACT|nr:hypothetical protein [Cystobacter fuscus]ATB41699.1 hypothetical protein CYFUS_007169 [Cystobacter fuscus]
MRRLLFIAGVWAGLGLLGCGPIIIDDAAGDGKPLLSSGGAPVEITGVSVEGDFLELELSYEGGCEEHSFWLEWDRLFLESAPVQTRVVLGHEGRNDGCKTPVSDKRRFDLTPLKEEWRRGYRQTEGSMSILVEGAPRSLLYTF